MPRFRELDLGWPYLVYEFSYNRRVFYIGVAPDGTTRNTGRWQYVKNLIRHADAGTLTEGKAREFKRKSNQVLAKLIRAGLPEHEQSITWRGRGKEAARIEEALLIERRIAEGCLLANIQGNPNSTATVDDILRYAGVIKA